MNTVMMEMKHCLTDAHDGNYPQTSDKELKNYSTSSLTVDQSAVEVCDKEKKEESNIDEELPKKLDSLSLQDQGDIANNPYYFPRCEYKTRFEHTSAFNMKSKEYWGTYFRSTSRGGNADRLSNLKDKAYRNNHINAKGTAAKTGAFHSPFDYQEYAGILYSTPKKDRVVLNYERVKQYLYNEILLYKGKICGEVIRNFNLKTEDRKPKLTGIIPYYKNDYPCIIVSITTPILKNIESKTEKGGLYKVITAYFVAITNQIAWRKNVPIELVLRSSFGHNLPSVGDTGDSFRINVGLVPIIYTEVLAEGLVSLWDKLLSPLLESGCSFKLGIESIKLKFINAEIDSYNDAKKNDYEKRQTQKQAIGKMTKKPKEVESWKYEDSLFSTLCKVGDSSGRKVVHQLVRQDMYIDILANLVLKEQDQQKPDMAAPIRILLSRLNYKTVVTLEINNADLEGGFFTFKKNDKWVENDQIKRDKEFWQIVRDFRLALASNEKLDESLSSAIENTTLLGLYRKLEETNLEFIRKSGYQETEDGVGSDSDCESELYGEDTSPVFSRKIILVTGMRAINLATYVALYQITKYTEASSYKLLSDSMYYETKEAVSSVLNAFSDFFEVPTSIKSKDTKVAEVLFFDLTHCDSTNQDTGQSLKETMGIKKFPVIILDYTSATTAKIRAGIEVCFRHTDLILLVNSGLKNEQAGADMNPYGTLRIITLKNKDLMEELYKLADGALKHAEVPEKLPVVAHQIRKSYKDAGLTVTSAAIYTNRKKAAIGHSAVSLGKNKDVVFDYWNFIGYVREIKTLKLLGRSRQAIINLYHQSKNKFLLLGSPNVTGRRELVELINDEDIKSLNLDEVQKLIALIYSHPEELQTLLTKERTNIRNILSWDVKKIKILGDWEFNDEINSDQDFGRIEEAYDDLIEKGRNLNGRFIDSLYRYLDLDREKERLKKEKLRNGEADNDDNDIIAEMEEEQEKDECPDGFNIEMTSETEIDSHDERCSRSLNDSIKASESHEGHSDEEDLVFFN
ncbi:uncharacterized protein LOC136078006 [Hydra vulgaris]|uniref:Uncharacterized protein LOC136078006 n=1 Tax=Hydra vulgaris TaxID=6087 RepID=A0ABM4BI52_HYDVU